MKVPSVVGCLVVSEQWAKCCFWCHIYYTTLIRNHA